MSILNIRFWLKSFYKKDLLISFSMFYLISNLISTKNNCCVDTKAAFTVNSKTIIKFGYHCFYDDC